MVGNGWLQETRQEEARGKRGGGGRSSAWSGVARGHQGVRADCERSRLVLIRNNWLQERRQQEGSRLGGVRPNQQGNRTDCDQRASKQAQGTAEQAARQRAAAAIISCLVCLLRPDLTHPGPRWLSWEKIMTELKEYARGHTFGWRGQQG